MEAIYYGAQFIITIYYFYFFVISLFGFFRKYRDDILPPASRFAIVVAAHNEEKVIGAIGKIREKTGDRAVMRALHFFADDQRVVIQVDELERGNFNRFLQIVTESGESSWMYCQNCYLSKDPHVQGISIALALSRYFLNGEGAYRVHGGGFAGTIQAFVPFALVPLYVEKLSEVFGLGSCNTISIRTEGSIMVKI